MLPHPLHPAVIHLPLALAVLTPLFAALAFAAIRLDWLPSRNWAAIVLVQLLMVGSGLAAHETGEEEEENVERFVEEQYIEEHEEAGNRFVWLAGGGLILVGLGMSGGRRGEMARAASVLFSLLVLAAALNTGRLGGELVYRHGAARAHVEAGAGAAAGEHEHDHD